ncbi:MAG TPA: VWA domain-containing protein [Thermoanaerobaculia bacterium]
MALIAPLLVLLLAAAPATPAAPTTTLSEQISVDLVNVDVHVFDRGGRAVAGLPRAAFRVFDDDRLVEISHFSWVPAPAASERASTERATTAADAPGAAPRRIALFFDDLQAGERSRAPLLAAMRRELERVLAPDDLVSVVRFDGADLEVLLDGSTDRRRLARALEELSGYSAGQLRAAHELRSALGTVRSTIEDDPQTCSRTGLFIRAYSQVVMRQVEASAAALLRYAQRLGSQPGRRLLLHLSGGIPMIAGSDVLEWAAERCDGAALARGIAGPAPSIRDANGVNESRGYWHPRGSRLELAEYSNAELWRDVVARVNALGVTIYPVLFGDSESRFRSEMPGGAMTDTAASVARQNSRETLDFLAAATGGLMIDAARDTAGQMARLADDLGGFYSLAFTPASEPRSGVRRIRVEVDREGLALRHRESYRLQSREERIWLQLVDLLAGEPIADPLALEVDLLRAAGAEPPRLRVVVPFDRLSLIDSPAGGQEGRFTVYLAVRPAGGRLLAPRQRSIIARRADPAARVFTYDVELPESSGEVAVAVSDDYSGAVGFARQELTAR